MSPGAETIIIMGVDPGLASTGWGVIEVVGGKEKSVAYGVIKTEAGDALSSRLALLHEELTVLIKKYTPSIVAVEDIFFAKNVKTAVLVAQARGVILMTAAKSGADVFPYTPLQIKQALVGYGRAVKNQVQQMVAAILSLKEIPHPDHAADALALALCHAHSMKRMSLIKKSSKDILVELSRSASRKRKRFYFKG